MFLNKNDALLCVDLQVDFLPGGSLATPNGNSILNPIYKMLKFAKEAGVCIVATR